MAIVCPISASANSLCSGILGKGSSEVTDLQTRLNKGFRRSLSFRGRIGVASQLRYSVFRPFSVSEGEEFYPTDQLPQLVSPNQVIIFRHSREAGIKQIRTGVLLGEERAWIFVPSLQLWIYDSVNYAGPRTVGTNSLLHDILIEEFGEIELFHTHPRIAMTEIYDESPSFAQDGITFEQFKSAAALPSVDDIFRILDTIDLRKGESRPKAIGHIVHEQGMTTYSVRAFPYVSNGQQTGIYPAIATWSFTYVLGRNLSASDKIRLMFQLAEIKSTEEVSCMSNICKWTPESAPKLILQHTDF